MRPVRATLLLVLAAGCGAPPDPGECELSLGTAALDGSGFEEMPAAATLTPGAQGGFHVWLGYRLKNAPLGAVKAAHTVRREADGKLLSRGDRKLEVGVPGDDGWWQPDTATPAFLCPTPLGVSAIDVPAVFEVILTDADGNPLATQKVRTRIECPEDAQKEFCQRVCAG